MPGYAKCGAAEFGGIWGERGGDWFDGYDFSGAVQERAGGAGAGVQQRKDSRFGGTCVVARRRE